MTSSSQPTRVAPQGAALRRRRLWRGLILGGGGLLALNLFVGGFVLASRSSEPQELPVAIERVHPTPGAVTRPQDSISVDLDDIYTGVLVLDGKELPLDQLDIVLPIGQVSFQPGPEHDVARLLPGRHTARVVYWRQDRTRAESRSFSWTFHAG